MARHFSHRTFTPATAAQISNFEKAHAINFCDDFKAFLTRDNGFEIDEPATYDDYDKDWIYHVHQFHGLSSEQEYNVEAGLHGFFDPQFCPIAYPVGVDGSGDPLLQIASGTHRGKLAMLDHELWHGGMDQLLNVEDGFYPDDLEDAEKLPFNTFSEASADQIIEECCKHGFLALYEIDFATHLKKVEDLFNHIAEENHNHKPEPKPTTAKIKGAYLYSTINGKAQRIEEISLGYADYCAIVIGEAIHWRFRLDAHEDREVKTHIAVVDPNDGTIFNEVFSRKTNTSYKFETPITSTSPSGQYIFTLFYPDEPDVSPLTWPANINVVEKRHTAFTAGYYKPAEEKAILALEDKLGYRFCDDFRSWLKSWNGISFCWQWLPLWDSLEDEQYVQFETDIKQGNDEQPHLKIQSIMGLQEDRKIWSEYVEPPAWISLPSGLAPALQPGLLGVRHQFLYPVAVAPLLGFWQIAVGKRRGEIVELLDNEFVLEQVAQVEDFQRVEGARKNKKVFRYPFRNIKEANPDQVIDTWIANKKIKPLGTGFDSFCKTIIKTHEQAFQRLLDKYMGG